MELDVYYRKNKSKEHHMIRIDYSADHRLEYTKKLRENQRLIKWRKCLFFAIVDKMLFHLRLMHSYQVKK